MPSDADRGGVLVIVPTYNEVDSLEGTLRTLLDVAPDVHVLVVDDSSPDGTGELADRIAGRDARVAVLHRPGREGLGRAYLAGFARGLADGYGVLVEMDADGSHPASALPAMLSILRSDSSLGLVIGSRWVPGGKVVDWPAHRRWLSKGANSYARRALAIPVRDITAGYRAYRGKALAEITDGADIDSRGYCFQIDMTVRTHAAGWGIAETPIVFQDRRAGVSKMSTGIVVEAMLRVTAWGLARLVRRPRRVPKTRTPVVGR